MVLSVAQWCLFPHQGKTVPFSWPTTKALSGVLVRYEIGHTCITYIARSKTEPQGDTSHMLWLRRASVWKSWWIYDPNSNLYSFKSMILLFGRIWKFYSRDMAINISSFFFLLFFLFFFFTIDTWDFDEVSLIKTISTTKYLFFFLFFEPCLSSNLWWRRNNM